jgi:hypothetical protein
VIDYTVLCDDGAEVYIYADTKEEAFIDAIERGYRPASMEDIKETPE